MPLKVWVLLINSTYLYAVNTAIIIIILIITMIIIIVIVKIIIIIRVTLHGTFSNIFWLQSFANKTTHFIGEERKQGQDITFLTKDEQ